MINIYNDTKIYIACPAGVQTGGPEALHQLHYYMRQLGFNTVIAYYSSKNKYENPLHPRYEKYCQDYIDFADIEDVASNVLILPESATRLGLGFKNIKKVVWWLSVMFFDGHVPIKDRILAVIKDILKRSSWRTKLIIAKLRARKQDLLHLTASKFAYQYVTEHIKSDAAYLVEPISKEFLDAGIYTSLNNRSEKILYNPAKNSKVMQKLLNNPEGLEFVPLKGYTPEQLIQLYRTSKLYIDFGHFGGPERIPKETVYNGCTILVGYQNAAKNDFDVAIKDEYKIKKYKNVRIIREKIKYMLANFETLQSDFEPFREQIDGLERNFIKSIGEIFIKVEGNMKV